MSLRRQWTTIEVSISGWRWKVIRLALRAEQIASKHGVSFSLKQPSGLIWIKYKCHFEGDEKKADLAVAEFTEWVKYA